MEPKVVNSTRLRQKTRDILEDAKHHGQHFIVQTHGKPMVAIIGIDEYEDFMRMRRLTGHQSATPVRIKST